LDTSAEVGPDRQGWVLPILFETLGIAKLVPVKFCPFCGERLPTEDSDLIRSLYDRKKLLVAAGKIAEAGLIDQVLKALWHEECQAV
jgi:hypothetical protein